MRFGFCSCANYQHGYFAAYRHLAEEEPDLVLFLGDYIYELVDRSPAAIRPHSDGQAATTLALYRNRYAQYRRDPDLQRLHAAAGCLVTWDDHEVQDDYAGPWSEDLIPPADFLKRRAAAYQAFYEHMPLPAASRPGRRCACGSTARSIGATCCASTCSMAGNTARAAPAMARARAAAMSRRCKAAPSSPTPRAPCSATRRSNGSSAASPPRPRAGT